MSYKRYNSNRNVNRSYKEVMGFKDGFITIFSGDTYSELEWFRASEARYCKLWGWYFTSDTEIPDDLPETVSPARITWDQVAIDDNTLKTEKEIAEVVDNLIYEPGVSEWVGEVGDKVATEMVVKKAVKLDSSYGISTLHTMEDDDGNVYVWSTASRTLEEGVRYFVKGGIKALNTYHNVKQNILTRCRCTVIAEV